MAQMITKELKEQILISVNLTNQQLEQILKLIDIAIKKERRKIIADFEFGMLYQRHDDTMTGEKYFEAVYNKPE